MPLFASAKSPQTLESPAALWLSHFPELTLPPSRKQQARQIRPVLFALGALAAVIGAIMLFLTPPRKLDTTKIPPFVMPAPAMGNEKVLAEKLAKFGENAALAVRRLQTEGIPTPAIVAMSDAAHPSFWRKENILSPEGYAGLSALILPDSAFVAGQRQHWRTENKLLLLSGITPSLCRTFNTAVGMDGVPILPSLTASLPHRSAFCVTIKDKGNVWVKRLFYSGKKS